MTHVLVAGGGVSGVAAAKLALKRHDQVTISDRHRLQEDARSELLSSGVTIYDSGHDPKHLNGVDFVVISPGIPLNHQICIEAQRRKLPILSEIDFALAEYAGKIIAVTGTNGKSTTVSMTGHVLQKHGVAVSVGGNLGEPPSAMVASDSVQNHLVLELSSYQLEQSQSHICEAAAFTSFSPDHLQRHGSLAKYMKAKWKIFDWVRPGGLCVLTSDVDAAAKTFHMARRTDVRWVILSGLDQQASRQSFLPEGSCYGRHNEINGEIAVRLAQVILPDVPLIELGAALIGFQSLPFRFQIIGAIGNNPVINDSKSTNCESTCAALAGPGSPVVLLMGGKGKGESYKPILQFQNKIAALVCFGESGQSIADELSSALESSGKSVVFHPSLTDAVIEGATLSAKANYSLLFSPGCASFDAFKNFEDRGRFFNAAINQYLDKSRNTLSGPGKR